MDESIRERYCQYHALPKMAKLKTQQSTLRSRLLNCSPPPTTFPPNLITNQIRGEGGKKYRDGNSPHLESPFGIDED